MCSDGPALDFSPPRNHEEVGFSKETPGDGSQIKENECWMSRNHGTLMNNKMVINCVVNIYYPPLWFPGQANCHSRGLQKYHNRGSNAHANKDITKSLDKDCS